MGFGSLYGQVIIHNVLSLMIIHYLYFLVNAFSIDCGTRRNHECYACDITRIRCLF